MSGLGSDSTDYGTLKDDVEQGVNASISSSARALSERLVLHPNVTEPELIPKQAQAPYEEAPVVGIAVKLISISSLDMASCTFSADFNINVAWKGADKDNGPDIQFYNIVEEVERDQAATKKGDEGWEWFYRVRCRGTFNQMYDLHRFPFDSQDLKIDVRLKSACRLEHLAWGANGEACSCDPRALMDEFMLTDAKVDHCYMPSYKFGKLAGYDPEARLIFTVRRKPDYWVINFGIVSSVLCSMMGCAYGIPVENIGERLGVAMTLVLTMTATKYLMMEKLPSVAYMTYLDWHILICGFLLCVLTVQISLTSLIGHALAKRLEHICLPILATLWLLYHIGAGYMAMKM
jgi:hypothetical protein